jgi:hypothetical protein
MGGPANLYTKSERQVQLQSDLKFERINAYNVQIMISPRKTKTYAT